MKFELTEKRKTREIVTRSDDIWALLFEMATALGPKTGAASMPRLSGARGELEVGVEGGPQVKIRVLD